MQLQWLLVGLLMVLVFVEVTCGGLLPGGTFLVGARGS